MSLLRLTQYASTPVLVRFLVELDYSNKTDSPVPYLAAHIDWERGDQSRGTAPVEVSLFHGDKGATLVGVTEVDVKVTPFSPGIDQVEIDEDILRARVFALAFAGLYRQTIGVDKNFATKGYAAKVIARPTKSQIFHQINLDVLKAWEDHRSEDYIAGLKAAKTSIRRASKP